MCSNHATKAEFFYCLFNLIGMKQIDEIPPHFPKLNLEKYILMIILFSCWSIMPYWLGICALILAIVLSNYLFE